MSLSDKLPDARELVEELLKHGLAENMRWHSEHFNEIHSNENLHSWVVIANQKLYCAGRGGSLASAEQKATEDGCPMKGRVIDFVGGDVTYLTI